MNDLYPHGGGRLDVEALPQEGAASGYRLERPPDWFILELGNVCNLRCRSCDPLFSSRIAADPVHSAWAAKTQAADSGINVAERPQRTAGNPSVWSQDIPAIADMVASGADGNAVLSLTGGESFLIKQTWQLLEALIERGVAGHIFVGLATNGQQRSSKLAELAPQFRGFNVSVSIDAHGALYEYMRHGASWSRLVDNLGWLHQVPNVNVAAVPTLQNVNALDMVALLRFVDEQEMQLVYNVATWPARLRPSNLPPRVRRLAAERLRGYLETECRPVNLAVARGYCELLETPDHDFDEALFDEFMTFTNDLDASRGESFAEAAPELVSLLAESGIEWSDERRYQQLQGQSPSGPSDLP